MPATKAYLTKSLFQIGMECPTKLYYHFNPKEYANKSWMTYFLKLWQKEAFRLGHWLEMVMIYEGWKAHLQNIKRAV